MPHFKFTAMNKTGAYSKGEIEADNKVDAVMKLKLNYDLIFSLKKQSTIERQIKRIHFNKIFRFPDFSLSLFQKKSKPAFLSQQQKEEIKEMLTSELEEILSLQDGVIQDENPLETYNSVQTKRRTIGTLKTSVSSSQNVIKKKWTDRFQSISLKEKIEFTKQLSILLKTGVSLPKAIEVIRLHTPNKRFSKILQGVNFHISKGNQFSNALSLYSSVFPTIFVSMVSIGEKSGSMTKVLDDLVDYMKLEQFLKRELVKSSIYPAFVVVFLHLLLIVGSIFLIPRFKEVFHSMNIKLPMITQIVFFVTDHIMIYTVFMMGIIFAFVQLQRFSSSFRKLIRRIGDFFVFRIPIIKDFSLKIYMLQISSSLGILLQNGIQINNALMIVEKLFRNILLQEEIASVREYIEKGESLYKAFEDKRYFSQVFKSAIASGEYSGKLPDVLFSLSQYYEEESKQSFSRLSQFIQPVSMVLLALLIVPFLFAIYMPIAQISNQGFQ